MTGQQKTFRNVETIAGAALVGLGVLILYQNLAPAIMGLKNLSKANGPEALGVPLAVLQAALRVLESYASDRQQFLQCLLQQMLVLFWPLLLVMVGTLLSRESFTDEV